MPHVICQHNAPQGEFSPQTARKLISGFREDTCKELSLPGEYRLNPRNPQVSAGTMFPQDKNLAEGTLRFTALGVNDLERRGTKKNGVVDDHRTTGTIAPALLESAQDRASALGLDWADIEVVLAIGNKPLSITAENPNGDPTEAWWLAKTRNTLIGRCLFSSSFDGQPNPSVITPEFVMARNGMVALHRRLRTAARNILGEVNVQIVNLIDSPMMQTAPQDTGTLLSVSWTATDDIADIHNPNNRRDLATDSVVGSLEVFAGWYDDPDVFATTEASDEYFNQHWESSDTLGGELFVPAGT